MKKYFTLIILLCLITKHALMIGQQYIYKQYTTGDGLLSSEVYHVFQDSKGYIWFATDNGVSRYNGYEFENFDVNSGLPYNAVSEIYEDYKGRIWFVGMNRTLSYYFDGEIIAYKYNKKLISLFKTQRVPIKSSFFVDRADKIYISFRGIGIYLIDSNGRISSLNEQSQEIIVYNELENKILANIIDSLPLLTLTLFNNKKKKILNISFPYSNQPSHLFVNRLRNDYYLLFIERFVFKFGLDNIHEIKKTPNYIQFHLYDNNKHFWICYRNGGVDCYMDEKLEERSKIHYLKNKNVSSVLVDNNNGLWFSTLNEGVYYLSTEEIKYLGTEDGLESNNIKCIEQNNGNVWIANERFFVNKLDKNLNIRDKRHLSNEDNIQDLFIDHFEDSSTVYVGTNNALHVFNEDNYSKQIVNNHRIPLKKNNIPGTLPVNYVYRYGSLLLICGSSGFQMIKEGNVIFDSWWDKGFHTRINKLLVEDNIMWLATEKGLWKYANDTIEPADENQKLLKTRMLDIVKTKKGLILATKGSGILFYDGKKVEKISKEDGLNSNTIVCLLYKDSILWSGSMNGLNKTILKGGNEGLKIGRTSQVSELSKHEIRQIISMDENLYMATNKGLVKLNLELLKNDKIDIPVYITKVKVNDYELPSKNHYELKSTQNNLIINFEGLFYKTTNSIQYKYKLEGLDKNWILTNNREARYYYLEPGNYTFTVEANSYNGQKSEIPAHFSIHILPAIWQTWPFKIAVALLVFSSLILIFKIRLLISRRKLLMQKTMYNYKMQALVGQMKPHFIFNTLNSINNFILKNEKKEASSYLVKFSKLMRTMLLNSQNEYISLEDEIKAIEHYFEIEALRMKNQFEYSIQISDKTESTSTLLPSLLIQPFVENAILHGLQNQSKKGVIKIGIYRNENSLFIDIIDNGIGREQAGKISRKSGSHKKSLGTKITQNRLALIKKMSNKNAKIGYTDLYEKDECIGTKVSITLPLIINRK